MRGVKINREMLIRKCVLLKFCFSVVVFLSFLSPAQAIIYDPAAEFSNTSNPNGVWTFGYASSLTAFLQGGQNQFYKYNNVGLNNSNVYVWYVSNPNNIPSVWKNTSSGSLYYVQPGELSMHPGWSGQITIVRWTAPYAGILSLDGYFGAGNAGSVCYYIYQNGSSLYSAIDQSANGYFTIQNLYVPVGTKIDFVVTANTGGNPSSADTPLHATLNFNAVPIPATVWFFGTGLLGLLIIKRKYTWK